LAIFKSNNTLFEAIHYLIIMSGDDNRFSCPIEFKKYIDNIGCIIWVEISCWFISDDNSWIVDKSPRYRDSLRFSS
jgi:hypothetical protein